MSDQQDDDPGSSSEPPAPEVRIDKVEQPKVRKFDPAEVREKSRSIIAYILLGLLCLEVVVSFTAVVSGWLSLDAFKDIMAIIFGPTTALVGSAVGFYFGTQVDQGSKVDA